MTAGSHAQVEAIGRASRRAALLSALGVAIVIASLLYAAISLQRLQADRNALAAQVHASKTELDSLRHRLADAYFDLARSLCADRPPRYAEAKQAMQRALELRPDLRPVMNGDAEFQRLCGTILR